jgi:hypothetical protein
MKQFALAPLALAVLSTLAAATAHAEATALGEVTVTATREGQLLNETPATVGVIKEKTLREVKPGSRRLGQRDRRRRPPDSDPPAADHQPGLSLPRRRRADPVDRLL